MHEIEHYLAEKKIDGLIETSPGVRSVMIEYDQRRLPLAKLLQASRAVSNSIILALLGMPGAEKTSEPCGCLVAAPKVLPRAAANIQCLNAGNRRAKWRAAASWAESSSPG